MSADQLLQLATPIMSEDFSLPVFQLIETHHVEKAKLSPSNYTLLLPQPAWPKIQDRRMNSMTPQMFSMHLTCERQEAAQR